MDRHKKYWMDKKTLLYHIENMIKYDVGEKVFTFGMFGSEGIPRTKTITGIHIGYSYGDNGPSSYKIEYKLDNDEHATGSHYIRKYDEKIAKMIDEYHTFFDALKKDEG